MEAMPNKKHHVGRNADERIELETILRKGKASRHRQCHARILLLADTHGPEGGWSDSQIAQAAQTGIPIVERVRRVCVEHGLERKDPDRHDERKLDGKGGAQLIALCCGAAPQGRPAGRCACWRHGSWSWRSSGRSATRRCARP